MNEGNEVKSESSSIYLCRYEPNICNIALLRALFGFGMTKPTGAIMQ